MWKMTDVYGLDSEMLSLVPRPTLALLLLFPLNEKAKQVTCYGWYRSSIHVFIMQICEHFSKQEEEKKDQDVSSNVYFMKQTVENGCNLVLYQH